MQKRERGIAPRQLAAVPRAPDVVRQSERIAEAGGPAEQPLPTFATHPSQQTSRSEAARPFPRRAEVEFVQALLTVQVRRLVRRFVRPPGDLALAQHTVDVGAVRRALHTRPTGEVQRGQVEARTRKRDAHIGSPRAAFGADIAQQVQLGHCPRRATRRQFRADIAFRHGASLVLQGGLHSLDVVRDAAEDCAPRQLRPHRQDCGRRRAHREVRFKSGEALLGQALRHLTTGDLRTSERQFDLCGRGLLRNGCLHCRGRWLGGRRRWRLGERRCAGQRRVRRNGNRLVARHRHEHRHRRGNGDCPGHHYSPTVAHNAFHTHKCGRR